MMDDADGPRSEPHHFNGLDAEKRDGGRLWFGDDSGRGEVRSQMRTNASRDVGHSFGGGMLRFAPVSASKIATLVVSNANSTG